MENSTSEKFALLIKYEGDRTTTTNMCCIIYTLYLNCSVQCTMYIVQSLYKDIFLSLYRSVSLRLYVLFTHKGFSEVDCPFCIDIPLRRIMFLVAYFFLWARGGPGSVLMPLAIL